MRANPALHSGAKDYGRCAPFTLCAAEFNELEDK